MLKKMSEAQKFKMRNTHTKKCELVYKKGNVKEKEKERMNETKNCGEGV